MIAVLGASRPELGLLLHIGGAAVFFGAVTDVCAIDTIGVSNTDRAIAAVAALKRNILFAMRPKSPFYMFIRYYCPPRPKTNGE